MNTPLLLNFLSVELVHVISEMCSVEVTNSNVTDAGVDEVSVSVEREESRACIFEDGIR